MRRALTSTAIGLVLGTIAMFLGGVLSWGHYSTSFADRALSMALSWPMWAANAILPEPASDTAFVLGLIINYSFYIFVVWLLLRWRRGSSQTAA